MTVAYKPGERVVVVPEMSGDGWVLVGKFVRVDVSLARTEVLSGIEVELGKVT